MSTRRFFSNRQAGDHRFIIDGDELHHLKTVNRAKVGDEIQVFDGRGGVYTCRIGLFESREAHVDIVSQKKFPRPPVRVVMAPSLTSRRAMNVMMEKLTELGVDEIRPVICTRTDEKYSPSMLDKWQRIAVQSLKVNKHLWPTQIYEPVKMPQFVQYIKSMEKCTGLLLHIEGDSIWGIGKDLDEPQHEPEHEPQHEPFICIIGPPGDFVSEERQMLKEARFLEYKINDGLLKTETAAIAAAAILKSRNSNDGINRSAR